jgi:fatty-acyl-CoA synthase
VLLGGMTAGIVNPINPLLEPATIAAILRETGAKVVVTLKSMPKTDVAQKVAEAVENAPEVRPCAGGGPQPLPARRRAGSSRFIRPKQEVRHRARVLDYAAEAARHGPTRSPSPPERSDRVAAYFHTGGTTGLPKVAQHRFSGMLYNGWVGHRLLFAETDVLICPCRCFTSSPPIRS